MKSQEHAGRERKKQKGNKPLCGIRTRHQGVGEGRDEAGGNVVLPKIKTLSFSFCNLFMYLFDLNGGETKKAKTENSYSLVLSPNAYYSDGGDRARPGAKDYI